MIDRYGRQVGNYGTEPPSIRRAVRRRRDASMGADDFSDLPWRAGVLVREASTSVGADFCDRFQGTSPAPQGRYLD